MNFDALILVNDPLPRLYPDNHGRIGIQSFLFVKDPQADAADMRTGTDYVAVELTVMDWGDE